jgi:glutamyl-Q tRNA(Asp) synthetase
LPDPEPLYRGRFAPSPTGPLHLGSLIAALASYLDARAGAGRWLVRMEDLDPPREQPGAADAILRGLEAHGLYWDEEVMWQSRRHDAYRAALAQLRSAGKLFRCDCTRAMLGPGGACGGRCGPRQGAVTEPCAWRVAVDPQSHIVLVDHIQGTLETALGRELPDFTLLRKDGLFAYQLAVVVDDGAQAITDIVRGSDLLESTPRQCYLQGLLGLPTPRYAHLPVITNEFGQKFSKQNHAPPLDNRTAADNLRRALRFLHQPPPPGDLLSPEALLAHAVSHWQLSLVPRRMAVCAAALAEPG